MIYDERVPEKSSAQEILQLFVSTFVVPLTHKTHTTQAKASTFHPPHIETLDMIPFIKTSKAEP